MHDRQGGLDLDDGGLGLVTLSLFRRDLAVQPRNLCLMLRNRGRQLVPRSLDHLRVGAVRHDEAVGIAGQRRSQPRGIQVGLHQVVRNAIDIRRVGRRVQFDQQIVCLHMVAVLHMDRLDHADLERLDQLDLP